MGVVESYNWIIGHGLINLTDGAYYAIVSNLYMFEYFKRAVYCNFLITNLMSIVILFGPEPNPLSQALPSGSMNIIFFFNFFEHNYF